MTKPFFTFLLVIATLWLHAERVKADTEIYRDPGKETIAQLYKGSGIYVVEQNKDWTKIIAVVVCTKTGFDEYTLQLPAKTLLYDVAGQPTGKVYGKLQLPAGYEYNKNEVIFELVGYVRTSELDTNWIPEQSLVRMIDSARSKIGFYDLKSELERFRFFVAADSAGFIAWQMNDVPGLNYRNPVERLKLVFYENRLVAIFHKHPFKLKSKEVIMVDGRDNLIYLRDLNAEEKRVFGRLFLNN